jgi:hypothetical protein
MDRMRVSETLDPGSIPGGATSEIDPAFQPGFIFILSNKQAILPLLITVNIVNIVFQIKD